jgi:hypothetical protein
MRFSLIVLWAAVGMAGLSGCGGSESTATSSATAPASGGSGKKPTDPIALVVYEFFDAVRQGDTARANQQLTPLALERITKLDMNIAPPGSPTASFQVGEVAKRDNNHALVPLTWTDLDAYGKPYHEPILCELRVCDEAWRICGMAQDLGPSQPPMVMDFESLEGIAPQPTAKPLPQAASVSTASAAATAPSGAIAPSKEVAQDPFQQPVHR